MTLIVAVETSESASRDLSLEREVFGPEVDVVQYTYHGDNDALAAVCRNADAILTAYVAFDRKLIATLERCQLISVSATGYNGIDVDAASTANISVCCVDEYCSEEVADHTLLLILALSRRLTEYQRLVQRDKSWQFDALNGLRRTRDLTLGIIGFGKIGQAIATRANAFGMKIIAYDPHLDERIAAKIGVLAVCLNDIYAQADIISLNCGLNADNKHLIDADAFAAMSRRPMLINCARGGLVDEDALLAALDSGTISAAGLDVLKEESPDLQNSALLGRDNVIVTPHIAFYSDASILENRRVSAANIQNFLDGKHDAIRRFVHRART